MNIQINTDKNISGQQSQAQDVEETLNQVLSRFAGQITRLEVHLSDENGTAKSGSVDKRCLIEARLGGCEPQSTSDTALTMDQAVNGAAHKMVRLLDSELGKLNHYNGQ